MTSASEEKWRAFNFFFQSGRAKDLSAPLYKHLVLLSNRYGSVNSYLQHKHPDTQYIHGTRSVMDRREQYTFVCKDKRCKHRGKLGRRSPSNIFYLSLNLVKKGKVHPCTGTEALYRPYSP